MFVGLARSPEAGERGLVIAPNRIDIRTSGLEPGQLDVGGRIVGLQLSQRQENSTRFDILLAGGQSSSQREAIGGVTGCAGHGPPECGDGGVTLGLIDSSLPGSEPCCGLALPHFVIASRHGPSQEECRQGEDHCRGESNQLPVHFP